jgi:hypothetical protein
VKWGRRAVTPFDAVPADVRVSAWPLGAANDEWGNGRRWWIVPRRPCGEGKREREPAAG